jgi:hypothetical protein
MRLLQRLLAVLLLTAMLLTPSVVAGKRTPPDGRPKSVHVRSYRTKKGKTVRSYNRRAPKSKR